MRINTNNYNLSFEKQLRATANILNNGEPERCYIYELNQEDGDYFMPLRAKTEWQEEGFLPNIHQTVYDGESSDHVFVIESKDEECLGVLEADDDIIREDYQKIEFLETYSPYSHKNKDRNRKYIGQTLLAFAAKFFDSKNKTALKIPSAVQASWGFYIDKCNFVQDEYIPYELMLEKEDFEKLIKTNEQNTKGKIELVC